MNLLQTAPGITKCDDYYKLRQYTLTRRESYQEQDIKCYCDHLNSVSKIGFVPSTKNLNQGRIREGLMRGVYIFSKDEMLSVEDFSHFPLPVTAYSTVNLTGKFEQVCDQIKYFMFMLPKFHFKLACKCCKPLQLQSPVPRNIYDLKGLFKGVPNHRIRH